MVETDQIQYLAPLLLLVAVAALLVECRAGQPRFPETMAALVAVAALQALVRAGLETPQMLAHHKARMEAQVPVLGAVVAAGQAQSAETVRAMQVAQAGMGRLRLFLVRL